MPVLLLTLFLAICLWLIGGLFVQPITSFFQHYWPNFTYEGEQLLLWGGILLSALVTGSLVSYLLWLV